ncbi:MAG: nitroreductase family protein [Nanoarchaeota archaeon]|nr:nitroreductase family protein [Nanoarchaeota archaeon]
MDINKAIKERHSVRKYTSKKPDWRKIIEAIDYARLGPLAGNISTLKFLIVIDEEKIIEINRACQQKFISGAKSLVVVCSKKDRSLMSYGERGDRYIKQQAGAAIENFLLKITELGLATCWVGAFADENVRQILQIPEDVDIEGIFPIGYELGKSKQRAKPNLDTILFFDKWGQKHMKPVRNVHA